MLQSLKTFLDWFSGGSNQYMPGTHCLNGDNAWLCVTVVINAVVLIGYVIIGLKWHKAEKMLPYGPSRRALSWLKYIFIICGVCGYGSTILRMWWNGLRLFDLATLVLAVFTWKYILEANHLKVVYSSLSISEKLTGAIAEVAIGKQELEYKAKELERSNEELEQFAYVASHDLKAPLRAVNNLAGWIEEDIAEGKQVAENMALLKSRITHMDRLIDALLEYSRIGRQHLDKQIVIVGDMLKNILALYDLDNVEISIPAKMPTILANSTRLEQVFSNLIGNAIKHSGHDKVKIVITCEETNKLYKFCVADDGQGIDPRFHQKIFLIFQTLKPRDSKDKGTGIGLTLVQKIVNDWHGDVWLESSVGKGSKFYFSLPK